MYQLESERKDAVKSGKASFKIGHQMMHPVLVRETETSISLRGGSIYLPWCRSIAEEFTEDDSVIYGVTLSWEIIGPG